MLRKKLRICALLLLGVFSSHALFAAKQPAAQNDQPTLSVDQQIKNLQDELHTLQLRHDFADREARRLQFMDYAGSRDYEARTKAYERDMAKIKAQIDKLQKQKS